MVVVILMAFLPAMAATLHISEMANDFLVKCEGGAKKHQSEEEIRMERVKRMVVTELDEIAFVKRGAKNNTVFFELDMSSFPVVELPTDLGNIMGFSSNDTNAFQRQMFMVGIKWARTMEYAAFCEDWKKNSINWNKYSAIPRYSFGNSEAVNNLLWNFVTKQEPLGGRVALSYFMEKFIDGHSKEETVTWRHEAREMRKSLEALTQMYPGFSSYEVAMMSSVSLDNCGWTRRADPNEEISLVSDMSLIYRLRIDMPRAEFLTRKTVRMVADMGSIVGGRLIKDANVNSHEIEMNRQVFNADEACIGAHKTHYPMVCFEEMLKSSNCSSTTWHGCLPPEEKTAVDVDILPMGSCQVTPVWNGLGGFIIHGKPEMIRRGSIMLNRFKEEKKNHQEDEDEDDDESLGEIYMAKFSDRHSKLSICGQTFEKRKDWVEKLSKAQPDVSNFEEVVPGILYKMPGGGRKDSLSVEQCRSQRNGIDMMFQKQAAADSEIIERYKAGAMQVLPNEKPSLWSQYFSVLAMISPPYVIWKFHWGILSTVWWLLKKILMWLHIIQPGQLDFHLQKKFNKKKKAVAVALWAYLKPILVAIFACLPCCRRPSPAAAADPAVSTDDVEAAAGGDADSPANGEPPIGATAHAELKPEEVTLVLRHPRSQKKTEKVPPQQPPQPATRILRVVTVIFEGRMRGFTRMDRHIVPIVNQPATLATVINFVYRNLIPHHKKPEYIADVGNLWLAVYRNDVEIRDQEIQRTTTMAPGDIVRLGIEKPLIITCRFHGDFKRIVGATSLLVEMKPESWGSGRGTVTIAEIEMTIAQNIMDPGRRQQFMEMHQRYRVRCNGHFIGHEHYFAPMVIGRDQVSFYPDNYDWSNRHY